MPTVLSDPPMSLYAIVAAITLVLGIIALRRQKRTDVTNFGIAAVALVAIVIIDQVVDSPREQIVISIKEMEAGTQNKKLDDVFKHVSDKFEYKFQHIELNKKSLQEKAKLAESVPSWEGITVLSIPRERFNEKGGTAEQMFEVQPLRLPGTTYRYECVATFKKEGDRWKLVGFKLIQDGKEVAPPGL